MRRGAIADPNDLRKFAKALRRYDNEIRARTSQLNSQFRQLSGTWQDQQQRKFSDEFDRTRKQIDRYLSVAKDYAQFLEKEAKHIDAYLSENIKSQS